MKIRIRAAVTAMAFLLCFILPVIHVSAEEAYTYTVTFYAGNQGTFVSSAGISVRYGKGTVQVLQDRITVSGLAIGDIVSFDAQGGALHMGDAGKYYIKGIRESGRDNNTVTASAFKVEGDADYVIAYGIKGDTVAYKVNYQDEEGNALAESRTYYGNVGDKAVAAYLYIEGYTPQALAIAKTLSANEAENTLTFLYAKEDAPGQTETAGIRTEGQTENAGGSTGAQTGTAGGTDTGATGGAGAGTQTGTADGDETAGAQDGAEAAADVGDAEEEAADAEDTVNLPDDEVPLDQELLDLDDEDVPQANISLNDKKIQKGIPLALRAGIGAAAAAALLVLAIVLVKRKKAAETEPSINKNEKESE